MWVSGFPQKQNTTLKRPNNTGHLFLQGINQ